MGIPGYNKLENVTRCGCWAHLRRKFVDAIPDKKVKDAPLTNAEIRRDYCNKFFKIEESLVKLPPEDRYSKRLELDIPVLDAFCAGLIKYSLSRFDAMVRSCIG